MYEYIQNSIIEGTLKYLVNETKNVKQYVMDNWDNFFPPFWAFCNLVGVPVMSEMYYKMTGNDLPNYIRFIIALSFVGVPLYHIHAIMKENADIDELINKINEELPDEPPELIPVNVPYDQKYVNMWNKRVENNPDLLSNTSPKNIENLKHNVLFETTPFGNVIMYYDHTKSSFVYYCDKTLPYGIINSVGRHYALKFNCEGLFLDENTPPPRSSIEDDNKDEPKEPTKSTTPTTTIKQNPNVYAKFKSYRTNPVTSVESNKEASQKEPKQSSPVIEVNRYTCEGRLSNFDFLQRVPKIRKLSYKDFKGMYNKKKVDVPKEESPTIVSSYNTEGSANPEGSPNTEGSSPTEFIVV